LLAQHREVRPRPPVFSRVRAPPASARPSKRSGPASPPALRRRPPATDERGPLVSSYLAPPLPRLRLGIERESGRRAIRSLGPRASASSATYLGAPPLRATRTPKTLAPLRRHRSNPRVAPPPSTRAVAASRRRAAVSASPPLGKGAAGVPGGRACALRHRAVLAGAPPPPLLAVGRRTPSPPLRGDPVEFASACASFWCKPQAKSRSVAPVRFAPASSLPRAAARRRVAPPSSPRVACASSEPSDGHPAA
jgi:hypothetical protein